VARVEEGPDHPLTMEDAISGVRAARLAGMRYVRIAHNERADMQRRADAKPIIEDFRALLNLRIGSPFSVRFLRRYNPDELILEPPVVHQVSELLDSSGFADTILSSVDSIPSSLPTLPRQ